MVRDAVTKAIKNYEEYMAAKGEELPVLEAYAQVVHDVYKFDKDLEYGKDISKKLKVHINRLIHKKTNGYFLDLEAYGQKNNVQFPEVQMMYDVLKIEAPYLFHSYLLYLESRRQESERFYSPKLTQLNKHGLIQSMQDLEDGKIKRLCISAPPGTQKCQPLYSKVLTPEGFIEMGKVCVGTKVIAADGSVSTVISTSDTNKREIYELILDDGSRVRCSDNHIWHVQSREDRKNNRYRDIELSEMLKNIRVEKGRRANYSIDYVKPIDFAEKNYLLHPYVMGVILGDDGITSGGVLISTKDDEVVENVNRFLPDGYSLNLHDRCTYRVKGHEGNNAKSGSFVRKALESYGVYGKKSEDKFIPKEYLYGSVEQRIWLLRGLMDTDGHAAKSYCSFATISAQLSNDIVELVHSLGGYASVNMRKAGYRKNGEYIRCNDYYEIIIEFARGFYDIFTIARKKSVYKPKRDVIKRFITDIQYIGIEDCKCILIDNPIHLYITDNYTITHNTTLEKFFASWIIGKYVSDYSLFFSHNADMTDMFYRGVLDITTNKEEYNFIDIFPECVFESKNAETHSLNFGKYKPFASLQCSSIGAGNAGKVRASKYLYCDDLIAKIEDALNDRMLEKIWRIYAVDLKQRKLNQDVKELIIMTRWSNRDIIGRLKDLYGDDKDTRIINVPDIDPETGKSNFDYKYNGMTVAFFEDQALTMDEITYNALYKGITVERKGLLFQEDDLRRYRELPERDPDAIWGFCDSKEKGTDYMVLPVMYQYGTDYYMVDCVCSDNTDYGAQYTNLTEIIIEHNVQQCRFESNQGGQRIAYEVRQRLEERNSRCNITEKHTESNKEARILANADWVKKHILFKEADLYAVRSDYSTFMGWLKRYTSKGRNEHDDVPDCLALFCLWMTDGQNTRKPAKIIKSPI